MQMINHISSDEIKNNRDNYVLLDIREDYERETDGFIPKSEHIKGSKLDIYTLTDFFKSHNGEHIVVYCHSGARAQSLIDIVNKNNIYDKSKISNLRGGIQMWKASLYEIEYP